MPVAGQRVHGTIFRVLKLTPQVATAGAESAVYDCLVCNVGDNAWEDNRPYCRIVNRGIHSLATTAQQSDVMANVSI